MNADYAYCSTTDCSKRQSCKRWIEHYKEE